MSRERVFLPSQWAVMRCRSRVVKANSSIARLASVASPWPRQPAWRNHPMSPWPCARLVTLMQLVPITRPVALCSTARCR